MVAGSVAMGVQQPAPLVKETPRRPEGACDTNLKVPTALALRRVSPDETIRHFTLTSRSTRWKRSSAANMLQAFSLSGNTSLVKR
jgi:hypothetical protein